MLIARRAVISASVTDRRLPNAARFDSGRALEYERKEEQDVPEHQNAGQLRTACDRRRDSRLGAPVRTEAERSEQAFARQRGCLQSRTGRGDRGGAAADPDRKSTRLNSSHLVISYAVFCL